MTRTAALALACYQFALVSDRCRCPTCRHVRKKAERECECWICNNAIIERLREQVVKGLKW